MKKRRQGEIKNLPKVAHLVNGWDEFELSPNPMTMPLNTKLCLQCPETRKVNLTVTAGQNSIV